MAECRFKFPLLNGGRRAGLNDAGNIWGSQDVDIAF